MKKKLFEDLKTSIDQAREINRMKEQFIIGVEVKNAFVRVYDRITLASTSLTLEEAKLEQEKVKGSKIYKLVEVTE